MQLSGSHGNSLLDGADNVIAEINMLLWVFLGPFATQHWVIFLVRNKYIPLKVVRMWGDVNTA